MVLKPLIKIIIHILLNIINLLRAGLKCSCAEEDYPKAFTLQLQLLTFIIIDIKDKSNGGT